MKITSDLRAQMTQAANETGYQTPIVDRHPALILGAGESTNQSGETSVLVELRLEGGAMSGTGMRDYLNVSSANEIARKINLGRLVKLFAAAGIPDAEDTTDLVGRMILVTTKTKTSKTSGRDFIEFSYAKADGAQGNVANPGGGTVAARSVPTASSTVPGFLRK